MRTIDNKAAGMAKVGKPLTTTAIAKILKNDDISYRGLRYTKCISEVPASVINSEKKPFWVNSATGLNYKPLMMGELYTPCLEFAIYQIDSQHYMVINGQVFNIGHEHYVPDANIYTKDEPLLFTRGQDIDVDCWYNKFDTKSGKHIVRFSFGDRDDNEKVIDSEIRKK